MLGLVALGCGKIKVKYGQVFGRSLKAEERSEPKWVDFRPREGPGKV